VIPTEHFVGDFRRFASRAANRVPAWVADVRERAISSFSEAGFPTTREEDWKYTNVAPVLGVPFRAAFDLEQPPVDASASNALLGEAAARRLLFVNGSFAPQGSMLGTLPDGVRVESLGSALGESGGVAERHLARYASFDGNGFTALSTAFLDDGALVTLADGVELDRPVELVFVSTARQGEVVAHPRVLVVCGRGSRASLVESHGSLDGGATLTNVVAEIVLGDAARLEHVRVVREGGRGSHVATTEVVQQRDSRYVSSAFTLGASFLRHNLNVRLAGEGAECSLDGLYLVAGGELVDNHTSIEHAVPHGTSRELYKGVLAGEAKAVFNGKVIVRPDAQKSDAQQTNKNLLLARSAEVDTKPELQIFADDVKCAHGAAIGQLDPNALFYLKSRGIDEAAGRRLLTRGFAYEIVQRVRDETVRSALEPLLAERLEHELGEQR